MKKIALLVPLLMLSTSVFAECDFKKAARNKMLDQKIGISGNCDTQKAVKTQTTNKIDNTLDIDSKKIKHDSLEKKENIEQKANTTKKIVDVIK